MTTEYPVADHRPADPAQAVEPERMPVTHARPAGRFPRPILVFGDD